MQFFRSEEAVDAHCARRNLPRGAALTLEQVWRLSKHWYGNRMSPEFFGRTLGQAQDVFRLVGLDSAFWSTAES